jgi:hypothetical protein
MRTYVLSGAQLLYRGLLLATCPVFAVALTSAASAQTDGTQLVESERMGSKETSANRTASAQTKDFVIMNKTNAKLNFEMSDKPNSDRKSFSLTKGATMTDSRMRYIRIRTVRGKAMVTRTYDLQSEPKRYDLVWNKRHNCWDVWRNAGNQAGATTRTCSQSEAVSN